MWETIKNALMSVKDATGIEIPGLPADLGSVGDTAATAVQTATESATGLIDVAGSAAGLATDGVTGVTETVAGVSETATAAVESASQALSDIAGGGIGGSPEK